MPRSKARALARAALRARREHVEGEDDTGRTAARVDYVRREIRRRLLKMEADELRRAARLEQLKQDREAVDEG